MTNEEIEKSIDEGKFTIISLIGEGGAGAVYKAEQKELKRIVALKVLKVQQVEAGDDFARFAQESRILAELKHENIISVFSIGFDEARSQPYLAMEFLNGKSLKQLLNETSKLELSSTLKIMLQIADAVSFAHSKGIVHRDLKPENIMILDNPQPGFVKVLDFGLARILKTDESTVQKLTQTGVLLGSVVYMSPEQCSGTPADERSDIYSLGCILYECLVGRPPFQADNPIGLLYKHINEMPERLVDTKNNQTIPVDLERIVFKALQKNPQKRFQTMPELRHALECFQEGRLKDLSSILAQAPKILQKKALQIASITLLIVIGTAAAIKLNADIIRFQKQSRFLKT